MVLYLLSVVRCVLSHTCEKLFVMPHNPGGFYKLMSGMMKYLDSLIITVRDGLMLPTHTMSVLRICANV